MRTAPGAYPWSRYSITLTAPWRFESFSPFGASIIGRWANSGTGASNASVEEDLRRGVDHVVAAAGDERDPHRDVVDRGAEVVEGDAVGADEDEVLLGARWG